MDELALFIDIQGRLVNDSNYSGGITYNVLSMIISKLKIQVENIDKVL